jgi:hypothetical protein
MRSHIFIESPFLIISMLNTPTDGSQGDDSRGGLGVSDAVRGSFDYKRTRAAVDNRWSADHWWSARKFWWSVEKFWNYLQFLCLLYCYYTVYYVYYTVSLYSSCHRHRIADNFRLITLYQIHVPRTTTIATFDFKKIHVSGPRDSKLWV